jgi:uncharacterized protein YecE (DUF72 family)
MARQVVVGTCGYCVARKRYYATFPAIEIQQSFYRPLGSDLTRRWRAEAPEEFEFTIKAFQGITHPPSSPTWRRSGVPLQDRQQCGFFQDSDAVRRAWKITREVAATLRATWIIFQCPPSFDARPQHIEQLRWFFGWAERATYRFGLEVRHPSWTPELLRPLCRELDLIDVVDPFVRSPVTPAPRYYRLHGIGGYNYSYSLSELETLRNLCRGHRTYCMFNNLASWDNARQFMELIRAPSDTDA